MLPQIRHDEYLFSVPKFDINKEDIEDFHNELKGFHENFRDCFSRSESRDHFFKYMVGQFSELERKSIEPIALAVKDGNIRAMQHFVSDVFWHEERLLIKYHSLLADDLADPNGVLIFDESGFIKKGDDSIGVSRQYCGGIGKVENCQVGVFAAYASPHGYALVDKRLFIPEKWFTDEYSLRRRKCDLPENVTFMSKPQLAAQMLEDIVRKKPFPFKWVTADSIYGSSPDFIKTVEKHSDLRYFVSVPSDMPCWLTAPITRKKKYKYQGQVREKTILDSTEKRPITVESLAKSIHNFFWYRRKVSEGTKGPIEYEFTKKRVILSKDNLPDRSVWLIIRRTMGKGDRTYRYFISNAPVSTRLPTFVWLSGLRWSVEQCFEETKTELGMDHYEVRKYPGWNHHILTCMLAHFFLWHLKIRLGKKSTVGYSIAA
jgi:SRSO17 transposase